MRTKKPSWRTSRSAALVAAAILAGAIAPHPVSAEGLFDFFFGGQRQQRATSPAPQDNFFADPFGLNNAQPAAPMPRAAASSGPSFCVRSCDGKYFPLMRASASPVAMCQAFCPASATKVFFGSTIDSATSASGERYADSENAYAYRKALRADCTCNGRDPAGLAPVDLSHDDSLRPGDVVATSNGLVAYSGMRVGNDQTAEFTPVSSYPGLTAEVRARLGEMKIAPGSNEVAATEIPASLAPAPPPAPKPSKRAAAN